MIIHWMRRFNVFRIHKRNILWFYESPKSYNLLNFTRDNVTLELYSISLRDLDRSWLIKGPTLVWARGNVLNAKTNWSTIDNFVRKNSSLISFFAKLEKVINFFFLMLATMKSWCLPNFSIHTAPDCILKCLNLENFLGKHAPGPPLFIMPLALVIGAMAPILHL